LIVDLKPGELMLRPHVVIDVYTLRLVQSSDGDLNAIASTVSCMLSVLPHVEQKPRSANGEDR
jgi:hypothetical protein